MRLAALIMFSALFAGSGMPAFAQSSPVPDPTDPRMATLSRTEGSHFYLPVAQGTGTLLVFPQGEMLVNITINDPAAFAIEVSEMQDGLQVLPLASDVSSDLIVTTSERQYIFKLLSGAGLAAPYLVRVEDKDLEVAPSLPTLIPTPEAVAGTYRLRGDREVRPSSIVDDGSQTYITFLESQYLPGIFAIGPTGDEEVVDGYMRGDVFVIDRVHEKLVFRIDKEKATATRREVEE